MFSKYSLARSTSLRASEGLAGETTPIKCVYEGQSIMSMGNFMNNADLTQDLEYALAA